MTKDLDALPLPELPDRVLRNAEVVAFIRAAQRQGYELARREAQAYFDTLPLIPEGGVPVDVYNEAMQSLEKAVEERDALRKAQDGREPVGYLCRPIEWNPRQSETVVKITRRQQSEYGFTHPIYDSPPPKSDEPGSDEITFVGLDDTSEDLRVRRVLEAQAVYLSSKTIREIVEAAQKPKSDEASEVLALLDSGEWELTRHPDTDSMLTDEWCAKNRWSVRRTTAPFCGRDGVRCWSAPTPLEAFAKARAALTAQQSKGEA